MTTAVTCACVSECPLQVSSSPALSLRKWRPAPLQRARSVDPFARVIRWSIARGGRRLDQTARASNACRACGRVCLITAFSGIYSTSVNSPCRIISCVSGPGPHPVTLLCVPEMRPLENILMVLERRDLRERDHPTFSYRTLQY